MWIISQLGTRVNTRYLADYTIAKVDDTDELRVVAEQFNSRIVYILFQGTQAECTTYQERLDSVLSVRAINTPTAHPPLTIAEIEPKL